MKAWIQKNLLLIIFLLLFLLGLAAVYGAHQQQPVSATVTETGKVEYHKPQAGRAKSKGKYWQQIFFTYTDDAGEEHSASFTLRTTDQRQLTEVGDTIAVVHWPFGWTMYPNNTVITLGWSCSIIAVVYIIVIIYVKWEDILAWWKARREWNEL